MTQKRNDRTAEAVADNEAAPPNLCNMQMVRRLRVLEASAQTLERRLQALRDAVSEHYQQLEAPSPEDELFNRLARLQAFLIEKFPQYILQFEGALIIPGVAGSGEIGPGNVQFPNFDGGGTLKADPYRRVYDPNL